MSLLLEVLESRDVPSVLIWDYNKLPKGEQDALKNTLKQLEKQVAIKPAFIKVDTLLSPGQLQNGSKPAFPPDYATLQMTRSDGIKEIESALMTFDPGISLAMSAIQVKYLDDFFNAKQRAGSVDPKTGRFVGFLAPSKVTTAREAIVRVSVDPEGTPLAEAISDEDTAESS